VEVENRILVLSNAAEIMYAEIGASRSLTVGFVSRPVD
jgi:hypothetical protein